MIYGDQSQEGFLLRDYFCCDTNELRLQIRCRPITLEKRLLAYYAQIISEFYPPCYSLQHLNLLCANVYFRAHVRVFVCPAFQMDSGLLSVKPRHLHWGAPACWFITAALCYQSSSLSCIFWCTNMPPMHVSDCDQALAWRICDWRGTLRRGKRRWEEREGSKSLCTQWLGYSRQHCQHFAQRVAGKQGGRLWWSFDAYRTRVRVCVYVCKRIWRTLITLIISSNYLQTANEFLRNLIMLCMCSHHHPFCTAAINLLINKYN